MWLVNSILLFLAFKLRRWFCSQSNLDLSGCPQISNSVVRIILQGCPHLQSLGLDNCQKVTHAAFDLDQSPFQCLVGCLSLEQLSLQGCPQIKGDIIGTLNANCRRLRSLNISQVSDPLVQHTVSIVF